MRKILLVVTAAAVALGACNKSPGAASAPSASAPAASTLASGAPHRRSGLWETSVMMNGKAMPMGSMKMCVDEAMDAKASVFSHTGPGGMASSHCSNGAFTRGLDGSYSFTSTCPAPGGGQVVTKGAASGDWSSAYHVHMETVATGSSMPAVNRQTVMDMDGKWLGPCPAGMAGGDMEFGNGMKISGGKIAGAAAMLHGMTNGGSSSGGQ